MNSVSSFFDPVQRQFSTVLDGKFWTKGKVITVSVVIGVLGVFLAYRLGGGFFNAVSSVPSTQNLAHKTFEICSESSFERQNLMGTRPAVAMTIPQIMQNLAHKTFGICTNSSYERLLVQNLLSGTVVNTVPQVEPSLVVLPTITPTFVFFNFLLLTPVFFDL